MRDNYKFVNSREVKEFGYDPENRICVVHYNHYNSGATIYYHDVDQADFDLLKASNWAARTAEIIFKDKKQSHGKASGISSSSIPHSI